MKSFKICLLGMLSLSLFACASNSGGAKKVKLGPVYEKGNMVCEYSKKTGSNIKKPRCWTKDQYEAYKKASREEAKRFMRSNMQDNSK